MTDTQYIKIIGAKENATIASEPLDLTQRPVTHSQQ